MYKFLYEYLKPMYEDKCCVAYTDTDSFILSVQTVKILTCSTRQITHGPMNTTFHRRIKKIAGLYKDVAEGKIPGDYAGLGAKCYVVRTLDEIITEARWSEIKQNEAAKGITESVKLPIEKVLKRKLKKIDEIKEAKGVKKSVVKKTISFDDYIECLKTNHHLTRAQNTFRSIKHNMYSIHQEKIALNPGDDKRYLIEPDRVDTLAWGHYLIDQYGKEKISESSDQL